MSTPRCALCTCSLFSVPKAKKRGVTVSFDDTKCFLIDKDQELVAEREDCTTLSVSDIPHIEGVNSTETNELLMRLTLYKTSRKHVHKERLHSQESKIRAHTKRHAMQRYITSQTWLAIPNRTRITCTNDTAIQHEMNQPDSKTIGLQKTIEDNRGHSSNETID